MPITSFEVVDEHFVDHIIELEKSKSYPGEIYKTIDQTWGTD